MCTCLKVLSDNSFYFGRSLDGVEHFNEKVVITPRNFPLHFSYYGTLNNHYAIMGMASIYKGVPLYAEAMNEKGLCMCALLFSENAKYFKHDYNKINIPSSELISFVLAQCKNIEETRKLFENFNIVNRNELDIILTPLHWMVSDFNESIVIESSKDGLKVYDNPYDVLCNNPPFPFHKENIKMYLNITPEFPTNRFSSKIQLEPFGNGFGSLQLLGDYSSPSRFVKAAFLSFNSTYFETPYAKIVQLFHIIDAVSPLKGSMKTKEGKDDYTLYSCCIDVNNGIYYYKTYIDYRIHAVNFYSEDLNYNQLISYEVDHTQEMINQNNPI